MDNSHGSDKDMKRLKGTGKVDYDYRYDILFFRTKDREYAKSIEVGNVVLDIDTEGFIVGIQIFGAAKFLKTYKYALMKVSKWGFEATVKDNRVELRLAFEVRVRNRTIEKNPIIMETISERLPASKLVCAAA